MAVPIADGIDQDTFKYQTFYDNGVHRQGVFEWGLDHEEANVPEKYLKQRQHYSEPYWSPGMIGNAMALNREFFFALGAFDPGLEIWGGEPYELTFKILQCGGTVEMVPCSHVAHVFRRKRAYGWGNLDPEIPIVEINLMRVVEVWMDKEYREYFYTRRPDMRGYPLSDLSERLAIKKRLQCKSFIYLMENFGAGVLEAYPPLPRNIAWGEVLWKDGTADYCWLMQERVWESVETNITLAKCKHWRGSQLFRFNAEGQIAIGKLCVIRVGDAIRVVRCPTQPIGDFQYELVSHLIRHIPTNMCVEGDDQNKELRLRACNYKEIKQKWKVREFYPKK